VVLPISKTPVTHPSHGRGWPRFQRPYEAEDQNHVARACPNCKEALQRLHRLLHRRPPLCNCMGVRTPQST
jgi:hypothetical protein